MVSIETRKLIVKLHQKGKTQQEIAELVDCSQPTVSLWVNRYLRDSNLKSKPRSGRPTKLTKEKLEKLRKVINKKIKDKNAKFCSLTTKELREIIHQELGELYSIRHVERLMHKLGFSLITPRSTHPKHDQEKVDEFRDEFKKKSSQSIWIMK